MTPLDSAILERFVARYSRPKRILALSSDDIDRVASSMGKFLILANYFFTELRLAEHDYRVSVGNGLIPYDPAEEASVERMFAMWLAPYENTRAILVKLRRSGRKLIGTSLYLANARDARRVVAGDSPFFDESEERTWRWFYRANAGQEPPEGLRVDPDGRMYRQDGRLYAIPGLSSAAVIGMQSGDLASIPSRSFESIRAERLGLNR